MTLPIELPFGRMLFHLTNGKDDEALIPGHQEFSSYQPHIGWQKFDTGPDRRLHRVYLSNEYWTIEIANTGILPIQIPANISTYGELRQWSAEQIRKRDKEVIEREALKRTMEQLGKQLLTVRRQLDLVP